MRVWIIAWIATMTLLSPHSAFAAENCQTVARLEAVQGFAAVQRAGHFDWHDAKPGTSFCQGDKLRTSAKTRAVVRLTNQTLVRLRQNTTLSFTAIHPEKRSLLELLRGAIHMMSRTPAPLDIKTPFVNAAIEGTEFILATSADTTDITVMEGKVKARNSNGQLLIGPGESRRLLKGHAPETALSLHPRNAVAWTLYYPALIDAHTLPSGGCPGNSALDEALHRLSHNQPTAALAALDHTPDARCMAAENLLAAALNLMVGDIEAARRHLDGLPSEPAVAAAIHAFNAIIAITNHQRIEADKQIQAALKADPDSPLPYLANSYLQQLRFDIPAALRQAKRACLLAPKSATCLTRLAELQLMDGDARAARQSANKAIRINPVFARNQIMLGFASLRERAPDSALSAFTQAIGLDSSNPLTHFGIGLIRIRDNALLAGREKLELAAMLDPGNAVLRSYLGRAYFEEDRPIRAEDQFQLAKAADPNDPTAWFYDALLLQSLNRPADALKNFNRSLALNDNRGIYRSRPLLVEDEAARAAALGRIYNDLGFIEQAIDIGTGSLALDPSSHAAHRLLADSYRPDNQRDSARLSEVLQAQMLQPLNLMPVPPQLADANLGQLDTTGPGRLSYNEYNPMFIRQGLFGQIDGSVSNSGWGDDAMLSALDRHASFSLGQFHFETDGYGENRAFRKDIANLFLQAQPSEETSLQFEVRHETEDKGDVALRALPDVFHDPDLHIERDITRYRVGLSREIRRGRLLVSAIRRQRKSSSNNPGDLLLPSGETAHTEIQVRNDTDIDLLDLQLLQRRSALFWQVGLSYNREQGRRTLELAFPDHNCPLADCEPPIYSPNNHQLRAYGYLHYHWRPAVRLLAGMTYAKDNTSEKSKRHYWLPKLGLDWRISPRTRLKAAAFRTTQQTITPSQYETLEPSQVAGFNQILDEAPGSTGWNYGLNLRAQLTPHLTLGARTLLRQADNRFANQVITDTGLVDHPVRIRYRRHQEKLYLNWLFDARWAASAGYTNSRFDLDLPPLDPATSERFVPDNVTRLHSEQLPLAIRYFHPNGLGLKLSLTGFRQTGEFSGQRHSADRFWLTDIGLTFRLPKKRGALTLGIDNLFDTAFHYEDSTSRDRFTPLVTAAPSALIPERTLYGRFSLSFR